MEAPWSLALLREELRTKHGRAWIAEIDGQVQGFACFRICAPECELLRLAVAPQARRCGIGSSLLASAWLQLTDEGCTVCFLEVRSSNTAARALYQRAGFIQNGIRALYYNDPVEDAILYRLNTMIQQGVPQ